MYTQNHPSLCRDTRLESAQREWTRLLGHEHAITEAQSLRSAATTTFATTQSVPSIIRPGNRDEVQECLRIANHYKIPIYVVSSGFNWGYGSRVPAEDGCVLLDLRRMNRIIDFSEDLAYVTVEPGVTQAQLFAFLRQKKSKLWLDSTGSTPASSLIGNAMERGFGHTPYGDHFAHICGMEVVLPTGECVETGFSRFPNATAASLHRWGVGPSLDGLFSQSNLGVVTRLTIWLMPAPEHFEAFFLRSDSDMALEGLIDSLRPLRMNGTIQSAVHIANHYKVLSSIRQYPWDELKDRTPLHPDKMDAFCRQYGFGSWNGSGGLYGTRGQIKEAKRVLRRALRGKADALVFVDQAKLRLAARFSRAFRLMTGWDISRSITLAEPVLNLLQGIPTDKQLGSTYWRKRIPVPADPDPDRDRCGLLWCSPVVPMQGEHVRRVLSLVTELLLAYKFEPITSLTLISERAIACIISITYDRAVAGEDSRAMQCYCELLTKLGNAGYYSYRLGIQSLNAPCAASSSDSVMQRLKTALDPNGILSPKRYHLSSQQG